MKSFILKTVKGNTVTINAHYKSEYLIKKVSVLDGWEQQEGKVYREAGYEAIIDGKVIMRSNYCIDHAKKLDADYLEKRKFPAGTSHAIINGWKSIALNETEAERYNQWVDALISEGKCAEEIAEEEAEKKKWAEYEIDSARKVIKSAETTLLRSERLMTNKEAKAWQKNYNDVMNEGGEGYVPSITTEESLRYALEILKKYNVIVPLSNKLKSLYAPEMA